MVTAVMCAATGTGESPVTTPVIGNSVMAGSARYHAGTGVSHSVGGSQHVSVLRQDQSEHVCGTKTFSQVRTVGSLSGG